MRLGGTTGSTTSAQPTVSVLVPAYEVAETLPRAVDSALEQRGVDVEVIVVDDASPTPATEDVAQRLASSDPRVKLLTRDVNGGPGSARADGLAAASGEWIAVLDADDRMQPGRLARLVHMGAQTGADLVADNLRLVDSVAGAIGTAFPVPAGTVMDLTSERILVNCVPGGRVNLGWIKPIVRRSVLADLGVTWRSFRHAEDVLFCLEVLAAGATGVLVGQPGYDYTQRRGTVSRTASPHSRTDRDADEQLRAFACFEDVAPQLSERARQRLADIRDEIRVTHDVLSARDAFERGQATEGLAHVVASARRPTALLRCLSARYGPRGRRVL